jgi:hypothetical protein
MSLTGNESYRSGSRPRTPLSRNARDLSMRGMGSMAPTLSRTALEGPAVGDIAQLLLGGASFPEVRNRFVTKGVLKVTSHRAPDG